MGRLKHVDIKVDDQVKGLFQKMCEEKGVELPRCIRDIIRESIIRKYVEKEAKVGIREKP
jgi:antitoxin component of RelBE/YafQ-DinJ toxin-antitoxin module